MEARDVGKVPQNGTWEVEVCRIGVRPGREEEVLVVVDREAGVLRSHRRVRDEDDLVAGLLDAVWSTAPSRPARLVCSPRQRLRLLDAGRSVGVQVSPDGELHSVRRMARMLGRRRPDQGELPLVPHYAKRVLFLPSHAQPVTGIWLELAPVAAASLALSLDDLTHLVFDALTGLLTAWAGEERMGPFFALDTVDAALAELDSLESVLLTVAVNPARQPLMDADTIVFQRTVAVAQNP